MRRKIAKRRRHEGYEFHAVGKDELEAYQTAIWSMKYPLDIFKIEGENT